MTYLFLFLEFFKTGLFAIGGGLATLPFLYDIAARYPWFTQSMLTDMIAIAESTPGPIGVNVATYAGFQAGGVLGAFVSTFALVLPSFLIVMLVARFLAKFHEKPLVQSVFYGLRPAVVGLIAAAGFQVMQMTLFHWDLLPVVNSVASFFALFRWESIGMFAVFLFVLFKWKKLHPIVVLLCSALLGILFQL